MQIWRMLLLHFTSRALRRPPASTGSSTPISTAMIPMTTSSSTSVNPRQCAVQRLRMAERGVLAPEVNECGDSIRPPTSAAIEFESASMPRSIDVLIKPEVFPVSNPGVVSSLCVEATLLLHFLFGRFQKVEVVNDHRVLVQRVVHHELLRADRIRGLLEEHVVRAAAWFIMI